MPNQKITLDYLRYFCLSDIEGLKTLLTSDLNFSGTFHNYHSAEEYLKSLRNDPPEKCRYKVLSVTENEDSVAVFYEYQKPERTITIAQLFKIRDQKIHEILLVFDGRGFA